MLAYQLTRMWNEKGAVKFDDRADCLALGVKWFQDSYAISAKVQTDKREKRNFNHLIQALHNDPMRTLDRLVLRKGQLDGLSDLARRAGIPADITAELARHSQTSRVACGYGSFPDSVLLNAVKLIHQEAMGESE